MHIFINLNSDFYRNNLNEYMHFIYIYIFIYICACVLNSIIFFHKHLCILVDNILNLI